MIATQRWVVLAAAAASIVSAALGLGCATTPPPPDEPPRPAEVAGLAPLSSEAPPADLGWPSETAGAAAAQPDAPAPRETACAARVGPLSVKRSALSHTLDAGLGTWLRGVDVEPKIDRGRFQGWRVRGVYAGDPCWADVDLRAGDVVSRVNRQAIERPEQAQAVWTALRTANEIVVDLFRAGRPRTLRFAVVDDTN